jgi:16S rRNA (adenine1518-N6/adenine1519-N6)-dimethyltransferase
MTHIARKRFGQNFLQDDSVIFNILAHANVREQEHWVEIGPGQGALTAPLLAHHVQLDVIELDRDLAALLQHKFRQSSNFALHSADALSFDFTRLMNFDQKLRVIGNLPYNISTPLLFHLIDQIDCIEDMHFMLQKEVVDRICAEPGSKKYGRLSVMLQYYCQTEFLFDVAPECFNPVPKVTSAIVKLTPHQAPPVQIKDIATLDKIVKTAFAQRRKTLRNSLNSLLTVESLSNAGIDPSQRAETVSLEEFARLTFQALIETS